MSQKNLTTFLNLVVVGLFAFVAACAYIDITNKNNTVDKPVSKVVGPEAPFINGYPENSSVKRSGNSDQLHIEFFGKSNVPNGAHVHILVWKNDPDLPDGGSWVILQTYPQVGNGPANQKYSVDRNVSADLGQQQDMYVYRLLLIDGFSHTDCSFTVLAWDGDYVVFP